MLHAYYGTSTASTALTQSVNFKPKQLSLSSHRNAAVVVRDRPDEGAAQPFFQCTPTLLSATWFGKDERALSTSIAINANQIGIATSFIVGGLMAQTETGMNEYFSLITFLALATSVGALLQFQVGVFFLCFSTSVHFSLLSPPPSFSVSLHSLFISRSVCLSIRVLCFTRTLIVNT